MLSISRIAGLAVILATGLRASTPQEISVAGAVAGRGLYTSANANPETSFDDEWARMVRISRFNQRVFSDPFAEAIWSEAQIDATRALAILARVADIDNRKPSDWDVVVSGLKAMTEDTKNKQRQEYASDVWVRLLMEVNKSGLQQDFRSAESVLDAQLAKLPATTGFSPARGTITIQHTPSWQGAYDNDGLVLTNASGHDLSSLAVFVTLRGKDGSSITHVHRASRWANNQKVYFRYPYYKNDYAEGQTVDHPVAVDVAAFSSDGSFEGELEWGEQAWDETIHHYLDDVKATGVFLGEYVEDGSNKVYYPGFKFTFSGLNRLPVKRIHIRFTRKGEVKDVYWDWNKFITPGNEIALRSDLLAQFGKTDPPNNKQIILEFTDSDVQATYTW
jgi:hypothetical protein